VQKDWRRWCAWRRPHRAPLGIKRERDSGAVTVVLETAMDFLRQRDEILAARNAASGKNAIRHLSWGSLERDTTAEKYLPAFGGQETRFFGTGARYPDEAAPK